MELKRTQRVVPGAKSYGFNRTFMELKHIQRTMVRIADTRFNRTFMELKQICSIIKRRIGSVLIGPSWN